MFLYLKYFPLNTEWDKMLKEILNSTEISRKSIVEEEN